MLFKIVEFLLVGRLAIFIIQKFPLPKLPFIGYYFKEGRTLRELVDCDMCFGVYVFTFLAFILRMNFIQEMFGSKGLIVIDQILTGMVASFVCHIFRIGWNTKFQNIVIVPDSED